MGNLGWSDANWTVDADVPEDTVYMLPQTNPRGYRIPFYHEVAWESVTVAEQGEAARQGWGVLGWRPLEQDDAPTIWEPYGAVMNEFSGRWALVDDKESGWNLILESAMCGDKVALKAMKDIVGSNPTYAEFKDTLDALTQNR